MELDDMLLQELVALELELKPKIKRLEELKTWCKERGTFATLHYVCSVTPRQRTGLVSLELATKALGRDMLDSFGLVQTTSFLIVSVSAKSVADLLDDAL